MASIGDIGLSVAGMVEHGLNWLWATGLLELSVGGADVWSSSGKIFLGSKFSGVGSDEESMLSSLSFIIISAVLAASAKVVGVFKERPGVVLRSSTV